MGKTLASVFSVRPTENATVSTPINWEEIKDIDPMEFTLTSVPDIFRRKVNPWNDLLHNKQDLEEILEKVSVFKV